MSHCKGRLRVPLLSNCTMRWWGEASWWYHTNSFYYNIAASLCTKLLRMLLSVVEFHTLFVKSPHLLSDDGFIIYTNLIQRALTFFESQLIYFPFVWDLPLPSGEGLFTSTVSLSWKNCVPNLDCFLSCRVMSHSQFFFHIPPLPTRWSHFINLNYLE